MEAYVAGVSTRSVDDLVAALGIDSGISKSEVSRICAGLDEVVTAVSHAWLIAKSREGTVPGRCPWRSGCDPRRGRARGAGR